MNAWVVTATFLLFGLVPCGVVCFSAKPMSRLVGLEMAGMIEAMLLVMLAEGMHRLPFYDLAIAAGLLAFGGGLVFVRFLERWL